ncbi:MAG: hypothetical protein Q9160_005057 [Pyrenula sp. 1 TL-2023]
MDILSASNYPMPSILPVKRIKNKRRQIHDKTPILGYVQEARSPDRRGPSSGEDESTRKRRKKQAKNDEDETIKKHRGRPRLDTQDETAAERRRTQIRLAQRAYRLRKETTIGALKKRIAQLEGTIEQLNKSFVLFSDNAMQSGALNDNPELAQQLSATTRQFLHLARKTSPESDQEEDAIDEITQDAYAESADEPNANASMMQSLRQSSAEAQLESGALSPIGSGLGGLEQTVGQNLSLAFGESSLSTESADLLKFQQWNLEMPEASASSHDMLTIERPFSQASSLFQELLKRAAGESLENWNVPFFRVGGAGTHYPRIGRDGTYSYPPNIHSPAKAFGPMYMPNPETPRQEQTLEQLLQAIGFGGKWFDSHDVESYLQEKGIHISAQSSFVDVDASILPSSGSLTVDTSSQEASPGPYSRGSRSPWTGTHLESAPHIGLDSFNNDSLLSRSPLVDDSQMLQLDKAAEELPYYSPSNQIFPDVNTWQQQVNQVSAQLITLDVDKFLEREFLSDFVEIPALVLSAY